MLRLSLVTQHINSGNYIMKTLIIILRGQNTLNRLCCRVLCQKFEDKVQVELLEYVGLKASRGNKYLRDLPSWVH